MSIRKEDIDIDNPFNNLKSCLGCVSHRIGCFGTLERRTGSGKNTLRV